MESQVQPCFDLKLKSYYPEDRGSPRDSNSEQMVVAAQLSEWGGLLSSRRVGARVPAPRDATFEEASPPAPPPLQRTAMRGVSSRLLTCPS